jgi:hypothetical protein
MSLGRKLLLATSITLGMPLLLLILDASTWSGLLLIWQSSSVVSTDFFTVGGFSAAFANAWLSVGLSIILVILLKAKFDGFVVAGLFNVAGFSFFGKTPLNTLPLWIGIWLVTKFKPVPTQELAKIYVFATALGPLVSFTWWLAPLPLVPRVILGVVVGVVAGMILPRLSQIVANWHMGYNLYNMGFTIGLVSALFALIYRSFGWSIVNGSNPSTQFNTVLTLILVVLFSAMAIIGWRTKPSLDTWIRLHKDSGVRVDFTQTYGWGASLLNMALLGFISLGLLRLLNVSLSGPIIAAIFNLVGFGTMGKHIMNVGPLIIGALLISVSPWVDATAISTAGAILLSSSLAPISYRYGFPIAVLAGMGLVLIGPLALQLQGGFALYNNGFAAGLIATFVVQVTKPLPRFNLKRKRT